VLEDEFVDLLLDFGILGRMFKQRSDIFCAHGDLTFFDVIEMESLRYGGSD
jgi:hypothetical protein